MFTQKDLEIARLFEIQGKKLLFHHIDSDGICSAALVLKFFSDFSPKAREGPIMDKKAVKYVESQKPAAVLWVDIPVDQEWKKLLKLKESLPETSFGIIDHHLVNMGMRRYGIFHINPRFAKKSAYIPASYVIYKLLEKLGYKIKRYDWIACAGVIGDHGTCRVMTKNRMDLPKTISELITSAIVLKGAEGAEKSLRLLVKSEMPDEFTADPYLASWHKIVNKEKDRILADFEKNREKQGDFLFYEINSRMNLTSTVSSILADKHPKNVVVIRKKTKDVWKISLRCQSGKVNVGHAAKVASKDIGSGGGHEKSSGSVVNDWDTFRKRLLSFKE
jgi:single-stranded DNA-specific DHH superfamily exonuclease